VNRYKRAVSFYDKWTFPLVHKNSIIRMSNDVIVKNLTFNELMTKLKHTDKSWADGL